MQAPWKFTLALGSVLLVSTAFAGGKKLPELPPADSPLRDVAAKYKLSMNMLLFPDYFMGEEQFRQHADKKFADSSLPALVKGLQAYGYKLKMPKSADEYRTQVYPKLLDFLKKCGYVAVEIPVGGADLALCPQLRAEIERLGLGVLAVGGTGSDLETSLRARVDAAHALGAKLVVGPVVLQFKVYPEDAVGDARVAWVQQRLKDLREPVRRAAEYAKSKDVKLAVEPLNRFELPGLNRLQEAIDFVKAVDHPHFGVMIDTCHEMSDGEGPGKFARQVQTLAEMKRLLHCHISAVHRGRIDQSWINWQGFFGAMKKAGYDGNMSMEIFDATEPFAGVVHINRNRFANPPEVALSALLHSATQLQKLK